jgi:hypothetical protein
MHWLFDGSDVDDDADMSGLSEYEIKTYGRHLPKLRSHPANLPELPEDRSPRRPLP